MGAVAGRLPGEGGDQPAQTASLEEMTGSRGRRQGLISSAAVGSANRGRVLQALFDLGPTSRAELARYAGVNRATITGIIQPLVDQGILVEGDALRKAETVGKPARPLWFAADARPICGVLLMHDVVQAGLVSLDGTLHALHSAPLPPGSDRDTILASLSRCIAATLSQAHRQPFGIGVAVGGMVDTDQRSIVAINLAPAMAGFALGAELERRFDMPVCVDHHPRALLVGDRWFGVGRGRRHFGVVYTGEVLGGALFLDGHLYRGPGGAGGELGHTCVQIDGEVCRCGRRGCWETIATLPWLRQEAAARGFADPDTMNGRRLTLLADDGDEGACELLSLYARNIAVGIANLQQTMAPDFVVMHGDVADAGPAMMEALKHHVERLIPPRPGGTIELAKGDSEDRAAMRGAAGLVLSGLLQFPL